MSEIQIRKGKIASIKRERGFGFVRDILTGQDRFFNASRCLTPFDSLKEGQSVEFEPYDLPPRKNPTTGRQEDGLQARGILVRES